ncbi:hypothetical protein APHAL10511_002946 [Amanita phalloides]|nr:hypothetical protein APHAL10511_002946 [Amanita phalloides]
MTEEGEEGGYQSRSGFRLDSSPSKDCGTPTNLLERRIDEHHCSMASPLLLHTRSSNGTTTRHARGLEDFRLCFQLSFSASNNSRKRLRNRSSSTSIFGLEGSEGDKGVKNAAKSRGVSEGMKLSALRPSYPGDILASHLLDWKSGAGQVVASLKCCAARGGMKGLWWASVLSTSRVLHRHNVITSPGSAERRCGGLFVGRWTEVCATVEGRGGEGWLAIGIGLTHLAWMLASCVRGTENR